MPERVRIGAVNYLNTKPLIHNLAALAPEAVLELDSLSDLLWSFVGGEPKVNRWKTVAEIPAETVESKGMSKELKRRGFRFVGPTTAYALMQAVGIVNDHIAGCYVRDAVEAQRP